MYVVRHGDLGQAPHFRKFNTVEEAAAFAVKRVELGEFVSIVRQVVA